MPDPLSIQTIAFLALAAFVAGFIDSIAGGGGLITLPALMAAGLPPHLMLGTNKLQATFGSTAAALRFMRAGLVPWRAALAGVAWTAAGAWLGTTLAQHLSAATLTRIIPFLLGGALVYTLVHPRLGASGGRARLPWGLFQMVFGMALGFYDGFFGPGTGSFWAFAFVLGAGMELTRATGHAKLMNATSNVVSLVVFVAAGQVLWIPGLAMGLAQFAGAWLGAHTAMRRGAPFIRLVLTGVVAGTILWLIVR
jgi:uncharacterized membrane protein YfcA